MQITSGVKPFPRESAWCVLGKKVGVIYQYPQQSPSVDAQGNTTVRYDVESAEVHFVDAKGETSETVRNVPVASLTQAKLAQIPAKRRPTAVQAKYLGYV